MLKQLYAVRLVNKKVIPDVMNSVLEENGRSVYVRYVLWFHRHSFSFVVTFLKSPTRCAVNIKQDKYLLTGMTVCRLLTHFEP